VADPWARLRHVRPREYAFADDFNAPADCLADLRRLVAERMPDCPGLEEVDAMLAQLPRFRPGDLVASRYYNLLVDALRKLRDYVAAYTPPPLPMPAPVAAAVDLGRVDAAAPQPSAAVVEAAAVRVATPMPAPVAAAVDLGRVDAAAPEPSVVVAEAAAAARRGV